MAFGLALQLALIGCAAPADGGHASVDALGDAGRDALGDGDGALGGDPVCATPELGAGGVAFGASDPDGCFAVLAPGGELEIVHGIQGGIHVIAQIGALRAGGASQCELSVELALGDVSVARFDADNALLPAVDPGGLIGATAGFPLVFTSVDASLYHGRDATLRGTVTVAGAAHAVPSVIVHLVDPEIGGASSGVPP